MSVIAASVTGPRCPSAGCRRGLVRPPRATAREGHSVPQFERVVAVIDEVDTGLPGDGRQPEQRSGPGFGVGGSYDHLLSGRGALYDVPVAGVRGQDVAVGGQDQPERLFQVLSAGDRGTAVV